VDKDEWRLAFYNNVNATLLFIPLMFMFGEFQILIKFAPLLTSKLFWVVMNLAGALGFVIGIVTIVQIKLTSALTHNMVGTAKSGLQTLLALILWQNPVTYQSLFGIALVLLGSGIYALVRATESKVIPSPILPLSLPNTDTDNNELQNIEMTTVAITKVDVEDGLKEVDESSEEDTLGENGFVRITITGASNLTTNEIEKTTETNRIIKETKGIKNT